VRRAATQERGRRASGRSGAKRCARQGQGERPTGDALGRLVGALLAWDSRRRAVSARAGERRWIGERRLPTSGAAKTGRAVCAGPDDRGADIGCHLAGWVGFADRVGRSGP
jgi:hypothetical protein